MLENFFPNLATLESHRASLLGPHLDPFVAALCELGYTRSTVRARLQLLDHLGRWLGRRSLALIDLQEEAVNRFLEERRRKGHRSKGDARAAHQFLEYLRENGAVPAPQPAADESPLATLRR